MSLLPSSDEEPEAKQEGDVEVLGVDDEQTSEVLEAISSDTSREILSHVFAEPSTPTEIAEELDESVQNVSYHLQKLDNAGAIEVADTRYSEKGHEMNVYGPADNPMVLFVGTEERQAGLISLIKRFFSAIGVLLVTSYLIGFVVEDSIFFGVQFAVSGGRGPDIPLAIGFLIGGFFVLSLIALWVSWRRYRSKE